MNKHLHEILAGMGEQKHLQTKYKCMSQLVGLCICILSGVFVYIVAGWLGDLFGIEINEPLKPQNNSTIFFWCFMATIPLSIIPSYFIVPPIFGRLMVKLGWLSKPEEQHFNKYGRLPLRFLK